MPRHTRTRWAVFAWDIDGDMGYGQMVGPFNTDVAADRAADKLRAIADRDGVSVDCVVVPVTPGSASLRRVVGAIVN